MGNVSGKKEETESPGSLKNEDEYEEEEEEEYMECAPFSEFTPQSRSPLFFSPQVPLIPSERTEGNVMVEHAGMATDNGIPTKITWHYDAKMGNVSGKKEETESPGSLKNEDEYEEGEEEYMEYAPFPEFTPQSRSPLFFSPQVPLIRSERIEGNVILDLQRTNSCVRKMGKKKNKKGGRRWIQHYDWKQKILLVGEGDFSFSACLAKAFGSAVNLVATCLHSREMLPKKHWTSVKEVEEIEARGGSVLYEVDVFIMNRHPHLLGLKFDIIIFNFPHAGHFSWLCERDQELIWKHRKLIKAYFRTAKKMLKERGEIHITLRQDPPYDSWDVEELARNAGLHLKEKVEFVQANYPGYHNKRGGNIDCNKKFPLSCCFTLKFTVFQESSVEDRVF